MHLRQLLPREYLPAELRSKTLLHLGAILATIVVGTIVFSFVDSETLGDSLYYIVMVMTLIGAQNPRTFGGQIIGIVVAVISVGVLVSFMTQILGPAALAQYWEGHRFRRVSRMKDHIVLCGNSATARALISRIPKDRLVVVVKDHAVADSLVASGVVAIAGDYETAETLRRAGIESSRAVIAASIEDSENAFVCLTSKTVAPSVPVLALVSTEENVAKLEEVRADHIIAPALLGATEVLKVLPPSVVGSG
jgi:voltage-gated potassium channel